MENPNISGLYKEGYIVSKLRQSPCRCEKTLNEKESGFFTNLSEKCTVDVHGERARIMEEPVGCDGVAPNDQREAPLNSETKCEMTVVTNSDELNDIHMSVCDGDLQCGGNDDASLENVVNGEAVDQGNDMLQLQEPDFLAKKEASKKGINLFVELLCSQDGNYEGSNNVNSARDHILRSSNCKGNETLPSEDAECLSAQIEEDKVEKQHQMFRMGDLVWAKTPNQIWWPGMIHDPSNAAKDSANSEETGGIFVKYFGNVNSLRCTHSNLKPFVEQFKEMSEQSNSSHFLSSIGKALSEFGWRVKAEMTCQCFFTGSQILDAQFLAKNQEGNLMSTDNMGQSYVPLSQFESSTFLASIRKLARGGSLPGKIEFTIIKNSLSAFYCSLGHCQLSMPQLWPPISDASQSLQDSTSQLTPEDFNDISEGNRGFVQKGNDAFSLSMMGNRTPSGNVAVDLDGKSIASGKVLESRERKKSKYLSYPYVDVNQGLKTVVEDGSEGPNHVFGSSSKPSSQSTPKNVSAKSFKGHHKISKSVNVDVSSAELLAELCSTALDCLYPKKRKHSAPLKRFYCSFRQFTFLDCPEADIMPRKAKKKKEGVNSAAQKDTNDSIGSSTNSITNNLPMIGSQETGSDVPGKGKTSQKGKKAGATPQFPQVHHISGNSFGMRTNSIASNLSVIGCMETGADVARKEAEATPEVPQVNMIGGLPDLNGNIMSFPMETMLFGGTSKCKLVPKRKKGVLASPTENAVGLMAENTNSFKTASVLEDEQMINQSNTQLNDGSGLKDGIKLPNLESRAHESEANVGNAGLGSAVQTSPSGVPVQSNFQPERKKRKRRAKTVPAASNVPDLNGVLLQPVSLGTVSSEANAISADGQSESKRRRRRRRRGRNNSDIPGSNVNINKASKKEEDLGAFLILNFEPGPPPSKDKLIPIFTRFGLLKESETLVLNDSTAQIAYERRSDGEFAVRSLEKNNPFGASLASFNIHFPGVSQTAEQNSMQSQRSSAPVKAHKTLAKPHEAPDLMVMRQNVEMMKSVLEKQGDSLSPEMRTKLENEIKGFLNKINTMVSSSSS